MADNATVNGITVATTEVGGAHYQRVRAGRNQLPISVQSAGLTTATTAYTAGDQVGTLFTFANAALATGGTGRITKVRLIDAADIIGSYDLAVFNTSVTLASDNAAFSVSDGDSLLCEAVIPLTGAYDLGNNHFAQALNISVPYTCAATSLFGALICREGHTFFGAVGNLQLVLDVERD